MISTASSSAHPIDRQSAVALTTTTARSKGLLGSLAILGVSMAASAPQRADAEPMPPVVGLLDEQGNRGDTFVEDEDVVPAEQPIAPPRAARNELRLELGVGGPAGLMAVRYSRVLSGGTRIEPAVGLGYTGVVGSLMVTQPLVERVRYKPGGTPLIATFEIYGGYSASVLTEDLRHGSVGREAFVPDGTYHWIDIGLSTQARWGSLRVTTGLGVTKLLTGPAGIGGDLDDEDISWLASPEGWVGKLGIAPSLWSSVGLSF